MHGDDQPRLPSFSPFLRFSVSCCCLCSSSQGLGLTPDPRLEAGIFIQACWGPYHISRSPKTSPLTPTHSCFSSKNSQKQWRTRQQRRKNTSSRSPPPHLESLWVCRSRSLPCARARSLSPLCPLSISPLCPQVVKSDAEWKKQLTQREYEVL